VLDPAHAKNQTKNNRKKTNVTKPTTKTRCGTVVVALMVYTINQIKANQTILKIFSVSLQFI
jgi:hypothetical protein